VIGIVGPKIIEWAHQPTAAFSFQGSFEQKCISNCNEITAVRHTHLVLTFTNVGEEDLLLFTKLWCQNAILNDPIDTNDEFSVPTFMTQDTTHIKNGTSSKLTYKFQVYEKTNSAQFSGRRNLICAIPLNSRANKLAEQTNRVFAFRIHDREFFNQIGILEFDENYKANEATVFAKIEQALKNKN
jgi:hypothetical protein